MYKYICSMNSLRLKNTLFTMACFVLMSTYSFAQQGNVIINQDKNIPNLLALKKELNKDENTSDRYKIYSFIFRSKN